MVGEDLSIPDKYRFGFLKAFHYPLDEPTAAMSSRYPMLLSWPKRLYHYTSLAGLRGIVESRGIWASHCRYMNDTREVQHGIDVAIDVLLRVKRKKRYFALAEAIEIAVENLKDQAKLDYYIACFSNVDDSLDQWRAYCADGGVSIEFDLTKRNPFFAMPIFGLSNVIYDERRKRECVLWYLRRYRLEFLKDVTHYKGVVPEDFQKEYARFLALNIEGICVTFKSSAFVNEFETRLLIHGTRDRDFSKRSFRSNRHFIVPYYSTSDLVNKDRSGSQIAPELLPISKVTIAPSEHQQAVAASVDDYLHAMGYEDIQVRLSTVPYRRSS